MRLGFTSLYSWRPHVEHMHYLAMLAESAGHEVRFLTCDGDLPACYIRQMRSHRPKMVECGICRLGGIKTYVGEGISSIGKLAGNGAHAPANAEVGIATSASTLGRFESDADYNRPEFFAFADALRPAARQTYAAARAWIEKEKLDAVFLFNGRMDITRSVLEAAKDCGIPYVSMERTWFGNGLQLLPNENCLGLRNIDAMVEAWRDKPLTQEQALTAASHIASRFLRRNQNEWRAYNVNATGSGWPVEGGQNRFLLLPGSRNEIWGHPDWADSWPERTAAFDALIDHYKLKPRDLVLRCHPNWSEKIGRAGGEMAEKYYADWAAKRGVLCIPSRDTTSTMSLIGESDVVVVAGGSAALEAGALGKQVIALSPCWYQNAAFQTTIYSEQQVKNAPLNKDMDAGTRAEIARNIQKMALRFCYTIGYRVAQFVPYVRVVTTTSYKYFEGADPERVTPLVRTGRLEADNGLYASTNNEEDAVLDVIRDRKWDSLQMPPADAGLKPFPVHRQGIYQAVDLVRSKMRRGDL